MGALQWYKIVHQHQGWRLVSCIWLHAGFFHLLANMVCLVFIGIRLEQQFGFGKFYYALHFGIFFTTYTKSHLQKKINNRLIHC